MFAKSQGGDFILRIEDTDQQRSHPVYEKMLLEAFKWLGLTWDEGPEKETQFGPYRQSERAHLYQEHANKLLEKETCILLFLFSRKTFSIKN